MDKQLSEEEDPETPDYLSNPTIQEYTHRLAHLIDDLHRETAGKGAPLPVVQLREILRIVYSRIVDEGELDELDSIFAIHFPIEYGPAGSSSIPDLLDYPLSGLN